MTSQQYVKALREIADFYEAHPDVPFRAERIVIAVDAKELVVLPRYIGSCKKVVDNDFFNLRKDFGGLEIEFYSRRENVCERIVIGKKVVPETIIPARPEEVIPEHEEEEFEWRCPESLLEKL